MDWQDWITAKYVEWRGDEIGKAGSISAFARWLGISQKTVNSWINEGVIPRSASTINLLVSHFGGEVYDVLGITPTVDIETENRRAIQDISQILKEVPRDKHGELVFAVRAWAAQQGYIVREDKGEPKEEPDEPGWSS